MPGSLLSLDEEAFSRLSTPTTWRSRLTHRPITLACQTNAAPFGAQDQLTRLQGAALYRSGGKSMISRMLATLPRYPRQRPSYATGRSAKPYPVMPAQGMLDCT